MKNRSFLFLIAALAMGLALFGCSTDSDSSTDTVYQGWAGDVEDIAAAFDKVDDVYLTRSITVGENQTLDIKAGKRLHLNGNSITLQTGSSVILSAANSIIWSGEERAVVSGKIVVDAGATVFLIGPSAAFPEDNITVPTGAAVVAIEPSATALTYTASDGRAFAATTNRALVFDETTGGWKSGNGGTKVVYIGDLTIPSTTGAYTIGGSLSVAGNLTLAGSIAGADGGLEVLGNLTSNINPGAAVTLVAGKLTARSINTKGGNFAKTVMISSPSLKSLFDGASTFTEALTALGPVQFTDSVTFTQPSTIDGGATFTGGKKVTGKVSVTGPVTVSGTDGVILAADGAIAYANGVSTTFLTGAGTLAALGGSISVKPGATELLIQDVSGKGTFSAGNKPITLSGSSQIKVEGTTGVYFDGVGSIASANYSIGNAAGTLTADKGFILTATGIQKISGVAGTPAITFNVAEDNGIALVLNNDRNAIIDGVNIDISAAGSIGVYEGALIITNGGSVTTASGKIAWGGTIAGSAAGGSLLVGSVGVTGGTTAAGILAGSVGTSSSAVVGVILKGDGFITTAAPVSNGKTGAGLYNDGGSSTIAGSILVFSHE